jgi:hypothetical protein
MAGVASAATVTCGNISNTGPGSTNSITCVDENNKQVICNNDLKVSESNDQTSSSGSAFTTDNTGAGGATSGDSQANNNVTVTLGASCAPVTTASVTTPTTPTTTPTPAVGGKGAAPVATPQPAAKPVSLPETGSNTAQKVALDSVVALGSTLVAVQLALLAYRRLALR